MEAPDSGATDQALGQSKTDGSIISGDYLADKLFSSLAADCARAQMGLYQLSSGGLLLAWGGVTRELPDLRAVANLLVQIGVR